MGRIDGKNDPKYFQGLPEAAAVIKGFGNFHPQEGIMGDFKESGNGIGFILFKGKEGLFPPGATEVDLRL